MSEWRFTWPNIFTQLIVIFCLNDGEHSAELDGDSKRHRAEARECKRDKTVTQPDKGTDLW